MKPRILVLVMLVGVTSTLYAQNANLSGQIKDSSHATVPNAAVTAVNIDTGVKRTSTSNDQGYYSIPSLLPGRYKVSVESPGFQTMIRDNITLNVEQEARLDFTLQVGAIDQTITVEGGAPLVNTTDGSVSTVVDRQFVANLPLNGRTIQSLILLTPGVVLTDAGSGLSGQFSVNGQRSNANYLTVDGVSGNTGITIIQGFNSLGQRLGGTIPGLTALGSTNGLVSVDALEEFKIQTSTYSAEFGRQPGGQISLVTKSGGNQFHGSLFEYLRNDVFDANDWFANAAGRGKSPLRQNQFGGTFSGPIMLPRFGKGGQPGYNGRNRTFFFFSYEGLRLRLPQAVVTTVPSLRLRQLAAVGVRPLLDAFPLPDAPELLDSSGQPTGGAPLTGVYSDPSFFNATSIRIDHIFNEKLTFFGRFNNAPSNTDTRQPTGSLATISESVNTTRSATFGATLALTPSLSNDLRLNLTRDRGDYISKIDAFGGAVPVDLTATIFPDISSTGISPANVLTVVNITFMPGGGKSLTQGPAAELNQSQINVVDNVSFVKGRHRLRFGIDYRRLAPTLGDTAFDPVVIFSNQSNITSGMAGIVASSIGQASHPVFTNVSAYGQDSWKLSRRLTADLGLRWEINPAPGGADSKKLVGVTGLANLRTATLAPEGAPLYKTFYRAFAPRMGVAYILSTAKGWERVVRGGFGVYYDIGNGLSNNFIGFPFRAVHFANNVPIPIVSVSSVRPSTPIVALPITSDLYVADPDLRPPYTLQWNLSLEQSLGTSQTVSASYVAAAGRRLLTSLQINRLVAGARPNSNFANIFYTVNGPSSDYESLQLQYQRRLSRGLQALVSYTWSHAIDVVSDDVTTGIFDRGNAAFDVRHNLSSAVTYDLPWKRTGRGFGWLIANWSISGIAHVQSATPVDLSNGSIVNSDGTFISLRPDLVTGVPLYIDDSSVPGGRRFNSAAFRPPAAGRQGTLGRNVLRGLPLYQVDMALQRQFNLTERVNLRLKAEAFNIFNHPNFGAFRNDFSVSSTFGVPTRMLSRSLGGLNPLYQIGGPRSLQLSVRLGF